MLLINACEDTPDETLERNIQFSPYTYLTWKVLGADATFPCFEEQGSALNGKLNVFEGF